MRRRRRREDDDETYSHQSYPLKKKEELGFQFFKIIHSGIIRDQKLVLPPKFVRKVGNRLSDVAVLKVGNYDKVWDVELKKSDRNSSIWFHKGWHDFVEYHSIRATHFLVFKYIGNSCFDVLIFDATGTEIQYPCDNNVFQQEHHEQSMHHHPSLMNIRSCSSESINWSASMKRKVQRSIEAAEAFKSNNPLYMLVMYSTHVNRSWASVNKRFAKRYLPQKNPGSLKLTVSDGRTWNVNYYSKISNHFLSKGWIKFVRDNKLKVGDVCVFELINKVDLLLKVSIFRDDIGNIHFKCSNAHNVVQDLPNHATEHSLALALALAEDAEQIEDDHHHDSVVRLDGHETCRNQQKEHRAIEAARAFKSKNPFYMLVMYSSYLHHNYAAVKARFSTKYLPEKKLGSLTLTVSDGRTWHVNYSSRRNNTNSWLNKGWINFVRENELKLGDVCVFELINRDDLLLKVSIFRDAKEQYASIVDNVEDAHNGRGECPVPVKKKINENDDSLLFLGVSPNGNESCTHQEESVGTRIVKRRSYCASMTSNPSKKRKQQRAIQAPREHKERRAIQAPGEHKEQRAIQAAEAFKSKNPFYICAMCLTYVHRSYAVVPSIFAQKYLPANESGSLILTVPDGRTWPVKYISRRNNSLTSLAKGWFTFVKQNNLKEGDVCVFELIDRKKLLLKVSVFRDAKRRYKSIVHNVEDSNDTRECPVPVKKEIRLKTPNEEESVGRRRVKQRLCNESMRRSNPSKGRKVQRSCEANRAQKEQRAVEAAAAFESKNPFYIRVMCSAYLHGSFIWVQPNFAKRYLPKKKSGSLILTVPDGRTWSVNYISRRNNSNTSLGIGWINFVKENELVERDVCVFELIDRDDLLLKVSIFRVASM